MKRWFVLLCIVVAWGARPLFGQDAAYRFKTTDIPLRFMFLGREREDIVRFVDVNNKGVVIGNTFIGDGFLADLKKGKKHQGAGVVIDASNQVTELRCPGDRLETDSTWLAAINNVGQIVGSCTDGVSPNQRLVGFVRETSGQFTLITFPGADGTLAFGINDLGHVVGQYWGFGFGAGLNRFHGFLLKDGVYTTIDAPDPDQMATSLLGINTAGQMIGAYLHHRPGSSDINDYDTEVTFLYDTGRFTALAFPGARPPYLCCGPSTFPTDINASGQVVGATYGPEGQPKFFLYAAGQYATITGLPTDITDANEYGSVVHTSGGWGLNDGGDIAGTYVQQVPCVTCEFGFQFFRHAFIATPKKGATK